VRSGRHVHGATVGRSRTAAGSLEAIVLWTILGILLLLWLIGAVSNVVGGLIHVLLVVALVVIIWQLVSGRRAV